LKKAESRLKDIKKVKRVTSVLKKKNDEGWKLVKMPRGVVKGEPEGGSGEGGGRKRKRKDGAWDDKEDISD